MQPRRHWFRPLLLLALLTSLLIPALAATPTQAQRQQPRCFPETGFCIAGPIRAYWESNGGLSVFGFPITEQQVATVEGRTLQTQWFERDRLEIQADGTITAGRLGVRLLELQDRPWQSFPQVAMNEVDPTQCGYFQETNHSLCEPFLSYWGNNGGLERFGYPITEPFEEEIEGRSVTVQYFERRRMELHAEFPGQVLLGLLGNTVYALESGTPPVAEEETDEVAQCIFEQVEGDVFYADLIMNAYEQLTFKDELGCPVFGIDYRVQASTQSFENGEMLWFRLPGQPRVRTELRIIHAFINTQPEDTFRRYEDTWVEGIDPNTPDVTPPAEGLYPPWGGFGKVWEEDPELRTEIGWAIEPQAEDRTMTVLTLANAEGSSETLSDLRFLVVLDDPAAPYQSVVYAFGDPDEPTQVQIIRP